MKNAPILSFPLFMRSILTGLLLGALLLPGCTSSDDNRSETRFTDDLDRTVEVSHPVNRVVSLAPNLTELVYAAGAGSSLVAGTTADDYPPAVDTLSRVSALPVDFEAVAMQEPDLVLATDQVNPPGDTETFSALDLPVYFFSFSSLTDVFEGLRTMGRLLGTETIARDSARVLEQQMAALRTRTESLSSQQRPRVLVLIGDETLYSFGTGSYIHTLVEEAGGRSITESINTKAPTLSEEYVLTQKPDVIIGAWGANYDSSRLLDLHPSWDVVPAIQENRVYSVPSSLLLRPGPRLVQGAWQMAHYLHPDRVNHSSPPKQSSLADTVASPSNDDPSTP